MEKDHYIGVALGWGAQIGGCQDGPRALLQDPFFHGKSTRHISSKTCVHTSQLTLDERLTEIHVVNTALSDLVFHSFARGERPCVIGGDHSIAVGTWNGVKRAVNGDLGLIWVDAHMDSHTFDTTPSGAPHGMPLAGLLGAGDASLASLHGTGAVLKPEHVCLIGTRSYEPGEHDLLRKRGVRIIDIAEIEARGVYDCFSEALSIASRAEAGFGVSFDLDVFDPAFAPGVGSRVSRGLDKEELLKAVTVLFAEEAFKMLELVEYNPALDDGEKTKSLAIELLTLMDLAGQGIFQDDASHSFSA